MLNFFKKNPPVTPTVADTVGSDIPHDVGVKAEVNNTVVYTTLYDESRRPITVPTGDVTYWLGRGFSKIPADPSNTVAEIKLCLDEFLKNLDSFYNGCVADNVIDRTDQSELAAASASLQLVNDNWVKLVQTLYAIYPLSERQPVVLVNDAGQELKVDPGQVSHYRQAYGYRVK